MPKIEAQCKRCQSDYVIHEDEQAFLEKLSFAIGETTIKLPLPLNCPDCRLGLRVCFRNERFLYKSKSAVDGKEIISTYHEKSPNGTPYKLYDQEYWRSDKWDPMTYGRDFDFSRPFFEQFKELLSDSPRIALITLGNENSDFSTGTGYCKNCYLINSSEYCEDSYYGKLLQKCNNCVDNHYLYSSELCYSSFSCYNCYNCQYLFFSQNCQDCLFSSNLRNCNNCFLSTNLNRKEYHFMNQPLSKEEYKEKVQAYMGSFKNMEVLKEHMAEVMEKMERKYANIVNSENCSGDYIENSSNCLDCYDVNDSQDCRYVTVGVEVKDNYDCSNMYIKPELCYQTMGTIGVNTVAYCTYVFHSQNMLYSDYCFNSSNCFGCTGLTRKEYCILNKQYSKEEYEALVPKIIEHMKSTGEWGEFFPPDLSPFGYNETLANEYLPLTREEAEAKGFQWREKDERDYLPSSVTIPDHIDQVPEDITKEILACKDCSKNYRIIPQELRFYRKLKIPAPQTCHDCRYDERLENRNPRHLHDRKCEKCSVEIQSTYPPESPKRVYCEPCYLSLF
jgi:hypothetical protein